MSTTIAGDTDYDELGHPYWRLWCTACGERPEDFDAIAEAEDWQSGHTCDPTEAQLGALYGGGGESPSYRQQMRAAGRGGLLR